MFLPTIFGCFAVLLLFFLSGLFSAFFGGLLLRFCRLFDKVFHALSVGRLVESFGDGLVGIDELLDLGYGLVLVFGELLEQVFELRAAALELDLDLAQRVAVKLFCAVDGLLLDLLSQVAGYFAHYLSSVVAFISRCLLAPRTG